MKSIAVNLLPQRQSWYLRRQRIWQTLQQVSVAVIVVYTVLLVGLFSWKAVLARQISTTEQQIEQTRQEIVSLAELEGDQLLLKSKLSRLTEVGTKKTDMANWFDKLIAVVPATVGLNDVKVESGNKVEVTGRTIDVRLVAELLTNLEDAQKGGVFLQQVIADSISKSSLGEYAFTLKLVPKMGGSQP